METRDAMGAVAPIADATVRAGDVTDVVLPQGGGAGCSCGGASAEAAKPVFVYALGRIQPRFPSLGMEKEYLQILGRSSTAGLSDAQAMHAVLSAPENRYLARRMCWLLTIENIETYLVHPRDPLDIALLLESLRATPRQTDVDLVVGVRGPIAPPGFCNGLDLPIVVVDQLYSFDVATLVKSIPRPEKAAPEHFAASAEELFLRIMQLADNAGATDEHRALNYLSVRSPAIYRTAAAAHAEGASLAAVDVRPSRLSTTRRVVDVIFSYMTRATGVVEKFFVRVDVTEEFPFIVSPLSPAANLSPYYDR